MDEYLINKINGTQPVDRDHGGGQERKKKRSGRHGNAQDTVSISAEARKLLEAEEAEEESASRGEAG